ncbi:uncharacterized protein LOC118184463 [Stegodyphus dumicola]|uniref:uncharacterized protein LOC118184463 n=1 Tax=Stegodyphus dumicola TaxID=202533 RepID=UPI0015B359D9|nr:uncharacterized protein LOC118184463 [Stegodyphus dumicola]
MLGTRVESWLTAHAPMFFKLESLGIKDDPYCYKEEKALEIFNKTVCFKAGRYEVTLPWKRDWRELADNYRVSENRLKALAKRMNYDKTLFSTYSEILDDYLKQGIIERVSDGNIPIGKPLFYLPHQPVFRETSASTKTRMVF